MTTRRPSGSRRSVGTRRSHSGWAKIAVRVASSGHETVYSITRVDGFPFVHRETARFRDLDPMGHLNNAVFLTWIETARIEFLRRSGRSSGRTFGR